MIHKSVYGNRGIQSSPFEQRNRRPRDEFFSRFGGDDFGGFRKGSPRIVDKSEVRQLLTEAQSENRDERFRGTHKLIGLVKERDGPEKLDTLRALCKNLFHLELNQRGFLFRLGIAANTIELAEAYALAKEAGYGEMAIAKIAVMHDAETAFGLLRDSVKVETPGLKEAVSKFFGL
jgi:hypothetical protein